MNPGASSRGILVSVHDSVPERSKFLPQPFGIVLLSLVVPEGILPMLPCFNSFFQGFGVRFGMPG